MSAQSRPIFTALLLALLFSNLILAALHPLTADEAHYALYALNLDWSYFDHPPMAGWIQAPFLAVNSSDWFLRLAPILLGLFIFTSLYKLTAELVDRQTALITSLLFIFSPLAKLLTLIMVPELPLVAAGLITLYFAYRLKSSDRYIDYIGLGLGLGLAGLSKYTAVTLAISVAGYLVSQKSWRLLMSPGIWLSGIIAFLLITPVLFWNLNHDWISFNYQINHGTGRDSIDITDGIRMQLVQFIAFGPVIYVFGLLSLIKPAALRVPERSLWLWFSLPVLLLFSFAAFKGRNLPHWTYFGVVTLLPVIAWEVRQRWSAKWFKILTGILGILTITIWLIVHIALAGVNLGYKEYQHPLKDLVGWREIAEETRALAVNDGKNEPIAIANWADASRISWYARPVPVKVMDQRYDQFDLWYGSMEPGNQAWVILDYERNGYDTSYLDRFDDCKLINERHFNQGEVRVNSFRIYYCQLYKESF